MIDPRRNLLFGQKLWVKQARLASGIGLLFPIFSLPVPVPPFWPVPVTDVPHRVCRRLQLLRRMAHHEQDQDTFAPEVRERAVRVVFDNEGQHRSRWQAIMSIVAKIGCAPQTLNDWVNNRRLLGPIGNIPPVKAKANF